MDPFAFGEPGRPDDTALARRLHAAGRVPLEALQTLLREARTERPTGGLSLGDLLVTRGLVSAAELSSWSSDEQPVVDAAPRPAPAPAPAPPPPFSDRAPTITSAPLRLAADDPGPFADLTAPRRDTDLARRLHAAGRVPLEVLRALLDEVRADRPEGDSLADVLVSRGHLDRGEVASFSGEAAPATPAPPTPLPGDRRFGDYRVVDELGAGGMGQVYLVEHATTGARYALKTLPADARGDLRERFRREAQAMAAVDRHPGIARVHAFGEDPGHLWYVMDLVPGGDLAQRLRERGALPPREAALLVRDLARAMAHVHAHGVLHRDLKPANVMFDERGAPRVVDFGLARIAGADALTRTGMTLGTPSYMPPEQVEGRKSEIDARSDVYGLGAILYHALTGRPPFLGPSAMNTLQLVLNERPTAPRSLAPDVPAELEAVCLRALEKRPADRYASAEALAAALDPLALGTPAAPARRGRRLVAAAAVVAVLVGAALGAVAGRAPGERVRDHLAAGRVPEAWAEATSLPPGRRRAALEAQVLDAVAARGAALLGERRAQEAADLLAPIASEALAGAPRPGGAERVGQLATTALLARDRGADARAVARRLERARPDALRACLAHDLAAAVQGHLAPEHPALDDVRALLAGDYRPGDVAPLEPALAEAAVRVLLGGARPRPDVARGWAEATPGAEARARLVARCALATPGGAAAALEALRPHLSGAAPEPAAQALALEALLTLDDEPRVAAEWGRWAEALRDDGALTPGLRAAAALAQGEWRAALTTLERPDAQRLEPTLLRRLRARARLGAGDPPAHAGRELGPGRAGPDDPAGAERVGVQLAALASTPATPQGLERLLAHEEVFAAAAGAVPRLGRLGRELAARAQAAALTLVRALVHGCERGEVAPARASALLERVIALRPDAPEAARLELARRWAVREGTGALPADADLAAVRARDEALTADERRVLDTLELLADGARGRHDRVLLLAERLAQRPPFADLEATAPLRRDAYLAECAAVAVAAWGSREAPVREALRARARAASDAARALERRVAPAIVVWDAHAALACGDAWEAQRVLEHVLDPKLRDAGWYLVLAECALLEGDAARAAKELARVDEARHDLRARRACLEAISAALRGDAAARDAALARAAEAEAMLRAGDDQDLTARLLPWRTAAETRRALERGWPPPGRVPYLQE